ncbi:MAG: DUF4037 domain-containing protein [Treponema sp.]
MEQYFTELWQDLSRCAGIEAIALAGSRAGENYDQSSDYDLYIYYSTIPETTVRNSILEKYCSYWEIGNSFWELEDDCTLKNGIDIDIIYRNLQGIADDISSVVEQFHAHNGYTTCLWYNLMNSRILYDKNKQLADLKKRFQIPYPQKLKQNIIKNNMRLLSGNLPSYDAQIKKAVQRGDMVSVHHRTTAFLESYFDIIFALNELLHPGEKRMVSFAKERASILPEDFEENIAKLLINSTANPQQLMASIETIIVNLNKIITTP